MPFFVSRVLEQVFRYETLLKSAIVWLDRSATLQYPPRGVSFVLWKQRLDDKWPSSSAPAAWRALQRWFHFCFSHFKRAYWTPTGAVAWLRFVQTSLLRIIVSDVHKVKTLKKQFSDYKRRVLYKAVNVIAFKKRRPIGNICLAWHRTSSESRVRLSRAHFHSSELQINERSHACQWVMNMRLNTNVLLL